MTKALREAKVHTSWLSPTRSTSGRSTRFVDAILDRRGRTVSRRRSVPLQAPRRRTRDLQQPGAAADQDHGARRAGLLSGHGAVGSARSSIPTTGGRSITSSGAQLLERADGGARRRAPAIAGSSLAQRARRPREAVHDGARALRGAGRGTRDVVRRRRVCAAARPPARGASRLFAFARRRRQAASRITCVPRLVATLVADSAARRSAASVWGDTRVAAAGRLAGDAARCVHAAPRDASHSTANGVRSPPRTVRATSRGAAAGATPPDAPLLRRRCCT